MSTAPADRIDPAFRALTTAERTAACLTALAYLPGVGPATLRRCHLELGAEDSWFDLAAGKLHRVPPVVEQLARMKEGSTERLLVAARQRNPVEDLARQRRPGWTIHVAGTSGYPPRLEHDPEAPALLFTCGSTELLERPTVALVGTRNATLAGRELAESMGADLARAGVVVVSGLALGIDGASHRGAIASARSGIDGTDGPDGADGSSSPIPAVGVVASGLDIAYPRRHAHLHSALASRGLLVSETPAGVRPDAWRFPARNRIIAGLSDAVVVIESRITGGSMHTVEEALARDVPVLAVPGHPSAPASAGTNALLYDGAAMARSADDVLLAMGLMPAPQPVRAELAGPAADLPASPAEASVLEVLRSTPSSLAELVATTGRTLEEVSHALALLEISGRIGRNGSWYEVSSAGWGRP